MTRRRFPLAPLAVLTGPPAGPAELGRRLGVPRSSIEYYRDHGVGEVEADRLACVVGVHPAVIWPDWLDDPTKTCVECGDVFVPAFRNPGQVYCRKVCRQRAWGRRTYAESEEFREMKKEQSRRYYEECGDYVRARVRKARAA